jgi:hypothetical protein
MRLHHAAVPLLTSALVVSVWPVMMASPAMASNLDVAPLYATSVSPSDGDAAYSSDDTLYVSLATAGRVNVYAAPNASPANLTASIQLPSGDQQYPYDVYGYGIDISADGRYLAVGDGSWNVARVYDVSDLGAVSQVKSASVSGRPRGVAFGPGNRLFVADFDNGLRIYDNAIAGGSLTLAATVGGLQRAYGVALDSSDNVYVSFTAGNSPPFQPTVSVFSQSQLNSCVGTCSLTPIRQIRGASTQLESPFGIDVDSSDRLYVANNSDSSLVVFAAGTDGDVAPVHRIKGSSTGLNAPSGMGVSSTGLITTQNSVPNPSQWMTFAALTFPPGVPTAVTGSAGNASAVVSWTAPSSDGGSAIIDYTATASPGGQLCIAAAPATSCDVLGLANGTPYTFTVTARNSVGSGSASTASGAVTPLAPPPPAPVPVFPASAPLDVFASGGDASATVEWKAPTSTGSFPVSTYQVTSTPGGHSCLTTALSCTVSGLGNGTTYTFRVKALNGAGWGASSEPSNAVTPWAEPKPAIMIAGTRSGRTIAITGEATGLPSGSVVTPWTRVGLGRDFVPGRDVAVADDGTFTWSRRASTKNVVHVYVTSHDVRSNTVRLQATAAP